MAKSREFLDYLGVISTIFLGVVIIYCLIIDPQFDLLINVFSDLGWHPVTANFFNLAMIIKGCVDCVFVWHAIRELKIRELWIKALVYLPMVSFVFIGVFPKYPLRQVHWFFVGVSFTSWMLMQYIFAKRSKDVKFIDSTIFLLIMEIAFVIISIANRMFMGIGEIFIMVLLVTWLIKFQKILIKR